MHPVADVKPAYITDDRISDTYQHVKESVVAIECGKWGNRTIGTGVIFDKEMIDKKQQIYAYYVVTNQHVIEKNEHMIVRFSDNFNDYVKAEAFSSRENQTEKRYKKALYQDIAIVRFESKKQYRTEVIKPYVDTNQMISCDIATTVFALGMHSNFYCEFSGFGQIRSHHQKGFFIHSAPINPGYSGGPLYALDGTLVGINEGSYDKFDRGKMVVGRNIAIDINQVAAMILNIRHTHKI